MPTEDDISNLAPAKAPAKSQRRKRNGPPQLQFVTATDPSQFKDEKAKRSVRSHAMVQYRYQSAEQKRRTKESREQAAQGTKGAVRRAGRVSPIMLNSGAYQTAEDSLMAQWLDEPPRRVYSSTSEAWWNANPGDDSVQKAPRVPSGPSNALVRSSRYYEALSMIPLNSAAARVIDYEDSDAHDELLLRLLVAKVATAYTIGDGLDPFAVIPQFASPELNSVFLVRKCNRAFSSASTLVKWLPAMLSHPHILLSSTVMASTWLDMHEGVSADSKRTALVKAECIGWINGRLRNPATQFEDSTLMIILHLLAGEMWSCNEATLRIHQSGIARLINHRGGMSSLGGNGAVAEVTAACNYHADIICEATSLPLFAQWEPPVLVNVSTPVPESPLFCPRKNYFSFIKDPSCSEYTYDLLCDMRDLTDIFIAHNTGLDTVLDVESHTDASRLGPSLIDYKAKVAWIRAKVASLPSAYMPHLPVTNDWIYEACRIAAIIYTSAIVMRVPLSVAAEPSKNMILLDAASAEDPLHQGQVFSTRLTEALYEVMEKSNVGDIWNDMAGVFYWVSAVGAAAARTPVTINTYQRPSSRSDAYATWVRRCLMMFATRAMIVLVFQHPLPILKAQKRLLQVQGLIGSGSSRRLVS